MKNTVAIFAILLLAASCNQSSRQVEPRYMENADQSAAGDPVKQTSGTDVTRMLREAELKFRVIDVQNATSTLEKLAVSHGGYVARSMYDINEGESIIKKINTDSAEEIKQLYQRNHMVVFVLNSKLDSFLDKARSLVDHLEYRHLTADDWTAPEKPETSANGLVKEYTDATHWNQAATNKKFARVIMDFYQTPVTRKWTIPNPDSFEVARGGFWDDFLASVKEGWRGVALSFNYLVSFWPLWLLLGVVWAIIRRKKGWRLRNILRKS